MSINQLIAQGGKPIEFESPLNQLAKVLQLRQAQQGIDRGQMEQDEYRSGIENQNRLGQVLRGFGEDRAANQRELERGGFLKQAQEYGKNNAEIANKQVATLKDQIALAMQKVQFGAQLLSGAKDQASYEASLRTAQANGLDVSQEPAQFDPAHVAKKLLEGQTVKEQLEQKWKEMEYTTPNANSVLSAKTSADNNAATQATARRGQNLVDGRAATKEATQQGGKPPAGYRYTPNGDLEAIPGGPADLKAQATAGIKAAGASDVDSAVAVLRDAYDRLEKGGGITSTGKGALSNVGSAISSSGAGQAVGRALGTNNQSARNDIAMTRPALLAALMKATGMSAKQMDSNVELKLWMATATDPTLDVEANRRALASIERKYLGAEASASAMPAATPQDTQALEWAKANPNDPRAAQIRQRLGQ